MPMALSIHYKALKIPQLRIPYLNVISLDVVHMQQSKATWPLISQNLHDFEPLISHVSCALMLQSK